MPKCMQKYSICENENTLKRKYIMKKLSWEFLTFLGMKMQKKNMTNTLFIRVLKRVFWVFFTLLGNKIPKFLQIPIMGKRNKFTINVFFECFECFRHLNDKNHGTHLICQNKTILPKTSFFYIYLPKHWNACKTPIMEKQNNIS